MVKDTLDHARDPKFDMRKFIENSYLHPGFNEDEEDEQGFVEHDNDDEEVKLKLVPTRRQSRKFSSASTSKESDNDDGSLPISHA